MQNTLEEARLTEQTNEPQPEDAALPPTQQEEAKPGTTAVVVPPFDAEIIESEVMVLDPPETVEDHTLPKQKPYWLLIVFTIFLCLLFLAGSYFLPVFTPSAAITLIPIERTITTAAMIQVQGKALPSLTLMQSTNALATGKRHQGATRAHGTITLYNGLFTLQAITAGTVLTGADGVQVVTDHNASIPAAINTTPPTFGHITVPAHAVLTGAQGNIPAYDINQACCASSVLAKNTLAFTHGAEAREYTVVTAQDIQNAASTLTTTLTTSEQAALNTQLTPGEALVPPTCSQHVHSDHQPGEAAPHASVTVSETCSGIIYAAHTLYANAMQLLTSDVTTRLGANYALLGDVQVTILHATITTNRQGQAQMLVQVTGTWVYQVTSTMQQHLVDLIAGKPKQRAIATLLKFPGIAGVQIIVKGGNQTLPEDPRSITIVVMYRT